MSRWIRFFIAILVGIGLGLLYGWVINPVEYVDTTPDTLRVDYKTDYILMVAEAYHGNNDVSLALHRLAILGNTLPVEALTSTIKFAQKAGYSNADLNLMRELLTALQAQNLILETAQP